MSKPAFSRITAVKQALGGDLFILAHHYQHDSVYRHADSCGDSLELSRASAAISARHIVFCGVHFMAETAVVLAAPGQKVFIPDTKAGCILSDFAPAALVETVMRAFAAAGRRIIPLAYVNTQAEVKAICGRHGGSVCTSANAPRMLEWALTQGDGVLFLPDRHLAANTCDALGIPASRRTVIDVFPDALGLSPGKLAAKDVIIWPGHCVIHSRLKPARITALRQQDPSALVVVHPECPPRIVAMADSAGSTSHIITYCAEAPKGATIYVGTEINLVKRLAARHAPDKTILPLIPRGCVNMAKITAEKLARQLENLDAQTPVSIPEHTIAPAREAVSRMIELSRPKTG